ncbi:hypothetical protein [Streptomyces sp. NPDC093260]|uniref:hypothetical protein n=1 Tax=Streptomyces sp. NPDC093260 TaxID=3155073 RepID=UPI003417087F
MVLDGVEGGILQAGDHGGEDHAAAVEGAVEGDLGADGVVGGDGRVESALDGAVGLGVLAQHSGCGVDDAGDDGTAPAVLAGLGAGGDDRARVHLGVEVDGREVPYLVEEEEGVPALGGKRSYAQRVTNS